MDKISLSFLVLILFFNGLYPDENPQILYPDSLLILGHVTVPLPIFSEEKNVAGEKIFIPSDLLKHDFFPIEKLVPVKGCDIEWDQEIILSWSAHKVEKGKLIFDFDPIVSHPELIYSAVYLRVDRWLEAKVNVESPYSYTIYLNDSEIRNHQTLQFTTGVHKFIIKIIATPQSNNNKEPVISLSLNLDRQYENDDLIFTLSPTRKIDITNVLDDPRVGNAVISPDGKLAAVTISTPVASPGQIERWIEIYDIEKGTLFRSYRDITNLNQFSWSPDGKYISYVITENNQSSLWIESNGTKKKILNEIDRFGSYEWAPTEDFILFSRSEREERDNGGVRRINGLPDRWPWWRDKSYLYKVNVPSGTIQPLTSGMHSTNLQSISPDGEKIILRRTIYNQAKRPYSFSEFSILDLVTMEIDHIHTGPWSATATWSPEGNYLLFTGGPSLFGKIGISVNDDAIPNEYDTQAYIYDLSSSKVMPITRNYDPSISSVYWGKTDNIIYFVTEDKSYINLYRYELRINRFELVDSGVDIITSFDISANTDSAVFTGESANIPPKLYHIDLRNGQVRMLNDPNQDIYRHIKRGKVTEWSFVNDDGLEIEGMIYFPPDFNENKIYPLIVYYYGGTNPVSRRFEGRYPKNLWAANGYIVYVPQPAGAKGYGQEFSSLHVNDWGKKASKDIVAGVKKFLDAHKFVDRKRIGAIGASYGGFMTMYLLTQTDIFAAAISHAGISTITGYWGEGYWGYLYSAIATAESFPWNRPDIYVERSPLYGADRISTPLLLIHGKSDTNVPVGESIRMYTALTLLGKEVEFVEVEGQNHHILDYEKRMLWNDTILSWFDKWLKNQSEWWDSLHGLQRAN